MEMSISMTEKVYMRELTEQEMTEIYQSHLVEDFPAGEVKPLAHMLEGRKKGQYEAYGLFEKDTLKGMRILSKTAHSRLHCWTILRLSGGCGVPVTVRCF